MKLQHKLNPEVTNSPKRLLYPCSGAADQDIEPGLEASSKKTQVPRKHKFQILEFLKVIKWSCFEILRQFEILFHHLDSEIVCPSVSLPSFWTCVAGVAYVWSVRAGWPLQLQKVKWTGRRTGCCWAGVWARVLLGAINVTFLALHPTNCVRFSIFWYWSMPTYCGTIHRSLDIIAGTPLKWP